MSKTHAITNFDNGGNVINISIHVKPDGGLSVDDSSYGNVADDFYGDGSGVDHSLRLKPEAANHLYKTLGGRDRRKRADKLAKMLVEKFRDATEALRKIEDLCNRRKVEYKTSLWIDGVW